MNHIESQSSHDQTTALAPMPDLYKVTVSCASLAGATTGNCCYATMGNHQVDD